MKDAYTTNELIPILNITGRSIQRRAVSEGWQSRPRSGRGGGNCWLVASMPESTRLALAARACPAAPAAAQAPAAPASPLALQGKARDRAQARAAVVLAARSFTVNSGLARTRAMEEFAARYNAGEIAVEPAVRAALPTLSRNSLINWDKKAATLGAAALAGNYGAHRRGTGCIDSQPAVKDVILGMFFEYPHVSAQLILEALEAKKFKGLDIEVPSLRRVQLWLAAWKRENRELAQYVTAPDKWRSRHMLSCGTAYELITEYNQRWEYDDTPADLLLNDGRRYTIEGVINVYSRELLLEVTERTSGLAVGELTRRALLEWGVPEEAVMDNGKEFVGSYMQGLFLDLGIMATALPPFRPDLKPAIERAFRSFSHHLLTLQPAYVGHNVAARQEIRERESFARRLMDRKEKHEFSIAVSPEELQAFCDDWCANVYAHRPHDGLKGRTPFEMRNGWEGVIRRIDDVRALDVLLLEDGQWREVTKKGVRFRGCTYAHAALAGMGGQRVRVRFSRRDASTVCLYDENNAFVCEAARLEGMEAEKRIALARELRSAQRTELNARRAELRTAAESIDAGSAAADIMDMHKARAAQIRADAPAPGHKEEAYANAAIAEAGRAVSVMEGKPPLQHGAEVEAAREHARRQAHARDWLPESPRDKFRLAEELDAAEARGEAIPADRKAWKECFKASNTYAGFKLLAQMGQSAAAG